MNLHCKHGAGSGNMGQGLWDLGLSFFRMTDYWRVSPQVMVQQDIRHTALQHGSSCDDHKSVRVHVPNYYILRPRRTYIGTTLMPMNILFGHMDPQGMYLRSIVSVHHIRRHTTGDF